MIFNLNKIGGQYSKLSATEYKRVFDEYYDSIRNFVYFKSSNSSLAEDITQDTFLKLWETRDKIDVSTVKSYLYTIAGNLTINRLKRQQLKYKFINSSGNKVDKETPEFLTEMKEYEEKLQEVIAEMTEGSREVFLMNRLEDYKYREIAERLDISVKAVEKRMSKALALVRERLGVNI